MNIIGYFFKPYIRENISGYFFLSDFVNPLIRSTESRITVIVKYNSHAHWFVRQ